MSAALSRRAALTGIGLAGATAMLPITAASLPKGGGDAEILAAWKVRQAALAKIESRDTYFDAETHSPVEAELFDKADQAITKATATTLQGLLAQAWVALSYTQPSFTAECARQNDLIRRADYNVLERERGLDWEINTQLATIRSLRAMIGEA
jgi:hypothetical protein